MISVTWNKNDITEWITSVTWSGSSVQTSRSCSLSVLNAPEDKNIKKINIKLGDVLQLFYQKGCIFYGQITERERTGENGTITITALDYMNHLLRSNGNYKFKNTTPEQIVKKVCADIQRKTGHLEKTKVPIKKLITGSQSLYDILILAYLRAKKATGKKYMPIMDKDKVCVIEKGTPCGVTLEEKIDIINSTFSEDISSMINRVKIFNEKGTCIGSISNTKWAEDYGVFQEVYEKESGIDAKKAAKQLLTGIEKNATIEALGNIKCVSGYAVNIKDKATGLTGKFWIENDEHVFEHGIHKMTLELAFQNLMEEAEEETEEKKSGGKKGKSQNPKINEIINLAKSYQGKVKYVFGAQSPNTGKSDCSGFTFYVFKKAAGIELGRTTNAQVSKGIKVYKGRLKIGDLVFFKNTYNSGYKYGVSHVGIYIGCNKFIHCSSTRGVSISDLGEDFYIKHWLMGRRIIE